MRPSQKDKLELSFITENCFNAVQFLHNFLQKSSLSNQPSIKPLARVGLTYMKLQKNRILHSSPLILFPSTIFITLVCVYIELQLMLEWQGFELHGSLHMDLFFLINRDCSTMGSMVGWIHRCRKNQCQESTVKLYCRFSTAWVLAPLTLGFFHCQM